MNKDVIKVEREWILLGRRIGLANRVVPANEALSDAVVLAKNVASLPPPPVRETLNAIYAPLRRRLTDDLSEVLAAEGRSFEESAFQTNLRRMLERSRASSWCTLIS